MVSISLPGNTVNFWYAQAEFQWASSAAVWEDFGKSCSSWGIWTNRQLPDIASSSPTPPSDGMSYEHSNYRYRLISVLQHTINSRRLDVIIRHTEQTGLLGNLTGACLSPSCSQLFEICWISLSAWFCRLTRDHQGSFSDNISFHFIRRDTN